MIGASPRVYVDEEEESHAHFRDKRHVVQDNVVEYKEVRRMEHLSFDKISSIQFCVDGAVGLPMNATATRVTTRLYAYDRSNVGEEAPPTYSAADSDYSSPNYDLHMSWRGTIFAVFMHFAYVSTL